MKCEHCGAHIEKTDKRCPYCNTYNEKYKVSNVVQPTFSQNIKFEQPEQNTIFEKHKKNKKNLIITLSIIIVLATLFSLCGFIIHRNLYGTNVSYDNFDFDYKINETTAQVYITPNYPMTNVVILVTYHSEFASYYYEVKYTLDRVKENKSINYNSNLDEITKFLNHNELQYITFSVISGKMQNKYANDTKYTKTNEQCSFKFQINKYSVSGEPFVSCKITNNTSNIITELRELNITAIFDEITLDYYNPRLILKSTLKPGKTISVSLPDKFDTITYKTDITNISKGEHVSTSCKNQTYKLALKEKGNLIKPTIVDDKKGNTITFFIYANDDYKSIEITLHLANYGINDIFKTYILTGENYESQGSYTLTKVLSDYETSLCDRYVYQVNIT